MPVDTNPLTAIHIKGRDGRLFCGFVNPNPAIGLVAGGINTATCQGCADLFVQSSTLRECPPVCDVCHYRHDLSMDFIVCGIFAGSGMPYPIA